ncbi:MAG: NAD(P)H-hydrate dehydratase, partial [Candidatus Paceibacterota bacterium]
VIITPHAREFMELADKPIKESDVKVVKDTALRLEDVILLKGENDIISDGNKVVKNKTGSPYMTTGGTGDVLAGICGSLLAQGNDPFTAAQGAAFINGRAGEMVAEDKGPSLLATDLIEAIPQVINYA